MRRITAIVLILSFLPSCSSLLHKTYKIQSERRILQTETRNFSGEKALTQWWYFDFFFDDGSVLVLMFVPHHWWSDPEKVPDAKTLIYTSYLKANGELISVNKIVDSKEIHYSENGLKSPYLEISKSHNKNTREYTINFLLDKIKGTAKITSSSKAFSPLPTGKMGTFGTRYLLRKGKGLAYRYAAHVPQGDVTLNLDLGDNHLNLTGKAYHEQGWFTGQAHQMGDGWVWFHFVSENINLFGARTFFYLEIDEEIVIGGLNSFKSRCLFTDSIFADYRPNFLLGGKLSFDSSNHAFEVTSNGKTTVPLVYIPSEDTDQVWGTTLQPSRIQIHHNGKEIIEEGRLLIETSVMSK